MAKTTAIEWADSSWSPWLGCTKVSEGCQKCYAFRWAKRTGRDPNEVVRTSDKTFYAPLRWKTPKLIFVCSLSDFAHGSVMPSWRQDAFDVMTEANHHIYLLLTKRVEGLPTALPDDWPYKYGSAIPEKYKHIWLGASVENQHRDYRIEKLLQIPSEIHFLSAEPLLSHLEIQQYLKRDREPNRLNWVIGGGESDYKNPRLPEKAWVLSLRDQCVAEGIPFFWKQWGGKLSDGKTEGSYGGKRIEGKTWQQFPTPYLKMVEAKTGFFCPKCGTVYTKVDEVPRCLTCNP